MTSRLGVLEQAVKWMERGAKEERSKGPRTIWESRRTVRET